MLLARINWMEQPKLGRFDPEAVDSLLADAHVHHAGYGADDIQGREDYKQYLSEVWATAFSEPQATLEQVIAEGDSSTKPTGISNTHIAARPERVLLLAE